jgi:hypothetical protein
MWAICVLLVALTVMAASVGSFRYYKGIVEARSAEEERETRKLRKQKSNLRRKRGREKRLLAGKKLSGGISDEFSSSEEESDPETGKDAPAESFGLRSKAKRRKRAGGQSIFGPGKERARLPQEKAINNISTS